MKGNARSVDTGSSSILDNLGVMGVSFQTAGIEVREKLTKSITTEILSKFKEQNTREGTPPEFVLLATCNRSEIYYFSGPSLGSETKEKLGDLLRASGVEEDSQIYHHLGKAAIVHLFEVSLGLGSLVIGETQILSQVRECWRISEESGLSGPIISKLFSKAYENARKFREANQDFSQGQNKSISHLALELIEHFSSKQRPNLLLVGSGKMIRLALQSIRRSKIGRLIVATKRKQVEGIDADLFVDVSEIGQIITKEKIDVVLTATSSLDGYILGLDNFAHASSLLSALLIVDIAVPRNVDPLVSTIGNVKLLDLDDLTEFVRQKKSEESEVVFRSRESIIPAADDFVMWMIQRFEINPPMVALRRKMEAIRLEEFQNALSRVPDLTDAEKEVMEKMSERLVRRLLHEPDNRLNQTVREYQLAKAIQYAQSIKDLFVPLEPTTDKPTEKKSQNSKISRQN